ncbi:MAG: class C sortase [Ancrocorticia sp.]
MDAPTLDTRVADSAPSRTAKGLWGSIIAQLIVMAGCLVLIYPTAAGWFSDRNHNNEVTGYTESISHITVTERSEILKVADDYNSRLPQGPLRDPYTHGEQDATEESAAYQLYESMLAVSESGVIGHIIYPSLGIDLPVYHGTSDEVISKGAGHLYGSSLPVGGPSTHAVLTAHSGMAKARLFTALPKATEDQIFTVDVLGEKHWYRVDQIKSVLPNDTDSLQIIKGEDYVTLITCTPIGVNSHRLLVRGIRIPPPEDEQKLLESDPILAGFPWWAVIFVGVSATSAYFLFVPPRRKQEQPQETPKRT